LITFTPLFSLISLIIAAVFPLRDIDYADSTPLLILADSFAVRDYFLRLLPLISHYAAADLILYFRHMPPYMYDADFHFQPAAASEFFALYFWRYFAFRAACLPAYAAVFSAPFALQTSCASHSLVYLHFRCQLH